MSVVGDAAWTWGTHSFFPFCRRQVGIGVHHYLVQALVVATVSIA